MSKQRARARAEREQRAAAQAVAEEQAAVRAAQLRRRRERRTLAWRRARLWQHGSGFRRRREAWGLFVTTLALCLFVAYLVTRSVADVLGTGLILIIVAPVLWVLVQDRSRR